MYSKVVSQLSNSGTGTQDFTHGESWQPKVAIFQWSRANTSADTFQEHMSYGKGFCDGTNQRCVAISSEDNQARGDSARIQRNNAVICALNPTGTVETVDSVAVFDSWLSNGIRINWTDAPATQFYVSVLLLGGDDITNAEVGTIMTTNTTGDKSITSLSWQPDYGMFLSIGSITENTGVVSAFISEGHATDSSAQHVTSIYSLDNPAAMSTRQYFSNSKVAIYHTTTVDGYATFSSFNSNGFTINVGDAFGSSVPIYYLLIKGGQFKVGHFTIPTGSPQQQTVTTNTDVKAVMIVGQNSNVSDTVSNRANIFSGMATETDNQYVDSWQDENGTADSVVVSRHDTNALCLSITANATASSSEINYEGAFYSKSASNFVINWTTLQAAVDCRYVTFGGSNLLSITKTVTTKFDIIQNVSKSVTAKYDIYQNVSKSVTAKYDIYQEIAKQATIKFDVYQEVTKTFTTIFDILITLIDVIKTFTIKHDIYEDVQKQATVKFDVYQDILKSATIKFDIIQNVIKKFKAVFDIIPTKANYIPLTGSDQGFYYIGYASYLVNVIKTITAKFDILQEVAKQSTVKYDIYQEVPKSVTVKFDIMQEIVKQFTVLHDIYEEVSKSFTIKHDIYQDVSKSVTVKFDILQEILKQFTVIFDILELGLVDVTKTFTTLFNINQEVSKSVTTKFDILQEILKTVTVKHDIYQEVAKSAITKFDILQEITKSATVKFDIIQEVTKQFTVIFDILELGLVNVTKTFTTVFDIVQEVQKSATTKFDIYQEIEKDTTIKFDIYEEVSKSVAIKFDIIQEVIKTNSMIFDILQQVEVSKTVKFDIYQSIEKDFTTIFDIIEDVEKQFTVIFNIESEIPVFDVEKIFTTKFDIYEDVEKSVSTKFDIIQEIVKRFRIKFNIKGKHHIDSDHAVMDNSQKDQFNKSDYSWNVADHRSKIKWSKKKGWFIDKA